MTEKVGGYVSKIIFNNNEKLELKPNDIVIFVGPNNAGKSQALKDIFNSLDTESKSVVVKDIETDKYSADVKNLLEKIAIRNEVDGLIQYYVLDFGINYYGVQEQEFQQSKTFKFFRNLFVANLSTERRLSICNPPNNVAINSQRHHPILYAAFENKYSKWLSDNFRKAFGLELIPDFLFGNTVPLCLSKEKIKLGNDYESESDRTQEYARILKMLPKVHNQGDGIKRLKVVK
jgi:energy-coupling factor transporter ATP-binding protein EcfA2